MTAALVLAALVVLVTAVDAVRSRRRLAEAAERVRELTGRVDVAASGVQEAPLESSLGRLESALADTGALSHQPDREIVRLQRALDAIPEGVLIADEAGEVVFRNAVAETYRDARHADALVAAALDELVGGAVSGRAGDRTLELFGPPRRTLVVSATPLVSGTRLIGAQAIIADVTERRRLDEVRRDFVANISHELKTPVGALALLAETLVEEEDPEITRRLSGRMLDEADRVARTIEDLLALTRIETESSPAHEEVDVAGALTEAVARIGPAAEQSDIPLAVEPPAVGLSVVCDRRQLVSALYNLLENAVKYSEAGSLVTVRAAANGVNVDLIVEDHGIGIPARDVDRIFERFYRVDHARSRDTGGTGLGLAIVRHVAFNHDGEVLVSSRLGEGSLFTLRLPAATPALATPEPIAERN